MNKKRVFSFLTAAIVAVSCGQSPQQQRESSALLRTVPSDALVVMDFDRCADVFQFMTDSTASIARIDPGQLKNSHCVLSYVYTGRLEPILAIDTGKAPADTTSSVISILDQADSLGLQARFFADGWAEGERSALIVTGAEAAMPAVMRHIEGLTSIYDAPDFNEATQNSGSGRGVIYLRNSGLDKSLPKSFLKSYVNRTRMIRFLQKSADWTVFCVGNGNQLDINTVLGQSMEHYTNVLATLPMGESRLGNVLPADAGFAVALPITAGFREQFESYLDANVRLDKYEKRISELKASCGKSPIAWEKEQDIREVAYICRGTSRVVLARPAKAQEDAAPSENRFNGFIPVLYGDLFDIDCPCVAVKDGWYFWGSQEDVSSFIECDDIIPESDWQYRNCHVVVCGQDRRLSWDPKGKRYGVYTAE